GYLAIGKCREMSSDNDAVIGEFAEDNHRLRQHPILVESEFGLIWYLINRYPICWVKPKIITGPPDPPLTRDKAGGFSACSPRVRTPLRCHPMERTPTRDTMKLLVVEDDRETALYLVKGLAESGYTVDRAGDGREGFFLATSGSYDAIVLDRMLPSMDGL